MNGEIGMSGEIIAIVSVGVGLAVLLVGLFAWLRSDMVKSEERLRQDIKQVESRLDGRITALESRVDTQIGELRERMAHLEGLLEGLREAITGRVAS